MVAASPVAAAIAGNRFGLGRRLGDVSAADLQRDLISQFKRFGTHPAAVAASAGSAAMAARLRYYADQIKGAAASDTSSKPADNAGLRRNLRQLDQQGDGGQARARIVSALATPAPFPERLVHFWANHVAVSANKLATRALPEPSRSRQSASTSPGASATCCSPSCAIRRCCFISTRHNRSALLRRSARRSPQARYQRKPRP